MARIAPIKTAAQATANYKQNGGSANAANNWATNLSSDLPAVFAAAAAAVGTWQQNVSTAEAATAFTTGLQRASNNTAATVAKINGPAKTTFQTQVQAAGSPGGNYSTFSTNWQPAVATEVANLNRTNPRGTTADNIARAVAMMNWAAAQKGKFKVK